METPSFVPKIHHDADKKRDYFDWIDLAIKCLMLVAAIPVIYEYHKDVMEKIIDERIKAFDEALTAAGDVVNAKDWETFGIALDKFGTVKHGKVLASIGRGQVYNSMVEFYNDGVAAWNTAKFSDPIPTDNLEDAHEKMALQFRNLLTLDSAWR